MKPSTVFIVEDDLEFTEMLRIRFEEAGCQVLTTAGGEDAFDLICANQPDVVVLDIFLPDVDGLTLLRRLKSPIDIETGKPSQTKDIPVVVITGKAPMIENMARLEGACDFFRKPVDMAGLVDGVLKLLETRDVEKKRSA